jgi:hypothetical protein
MKKLETFRCHIKVRGEQCPCDLTLVNTFTFSLATLQKKSPEGVTLETLKQFAICPWHMRFLARTRRDMTSMEYAIKKVRELLKEARIKEERQTYWRQQNARCESHVRARTPRMALALRDAGISV